MLCNKCKLDKLPEDFNWRNKAAGKRHTHCRECQKGYKKAFYEKDKSSYKASVLKSNALLKERNRRFVWDWLSAHPCVDCSESDPLVLEFDHLRDKSCCVSEMVGRKRSIASIEEEIAKCEVVCANCHKRRTAHRAGWYSDYLV